MSLNGSFHETPCHSQLLFEITIGGKGNQSKKKLTTEALPWGFTPKAATQSRGPRLKEFRSIKNILEGTTVLKDTANC